MYLLPRAADQSVLFGNTLLNVGEDEQSGTTAFSGDEGAVAEFAHEGLDGLHISFAPLDATGNALARGNREKLLYSTITSPLANSCVFPFVSQVSCIIEKSWLGQWEENARFGVTLEESNFMAAFYSII